MREAGIPVREHVKHIHFVGIGGSGMSGIAEVLHELGYTVSGSDLNLSPTAQRLRESGINVLLGHAANNVSDADVVVVSSAIGADNEEVQAAQAAHIPVIPRAEMLGELMRFRKGIAVAGTHGKTTTTSLLASILAQAGLDPTFIVGGLVNSVNRNARLGQSDLLVAEADESDASFLHLQPHMAIVTNIDADHMETYAGSFARLKQTFLDFLHNLPFYGVAVLCIDDPVINELMGEIHKPIVTYGFSEDAQYRASSVSQNGAHMFFNLTYPNGTKVSQLELAMPGKHNVLNALAAIAVADELDVSVEAISKGLSGFKGIGRRFQQRGEVEFPNGHGWLVDDYAHHPRELAATLKAVRGCWPGRRLVTVFQPHRYSRTRDLLDDFARVLQDCDPLIICEVYPAGEQPISAADGRSLCRAIRSRGQTEPVFAESLEDLSKVLDNLVQDGDIVLTLGAGDIGRFSWELSERGAIPGAAQTKIANVTPIKK